MKLKEEYNETATRQFLKDLKNSHPNKISWGAIYDTFGSSKHGSLFYGGGPTLTNCGLVRLWPQSSIWDPNAMSFEDYLDDAYNRGDYFHIPMLVNQMPDERMIINAVSQQIAIRVVSHLVSEVLSPAPAFRFSDVKFYGQELPKIQNKYDKVVVYYDRKNRRDIFDCICRTPGIVSADFLPALSAFYHTVTTDNDEFVVGVAQEIAGTSFTIDRAAQVFKAMTNQNYIPDTGMDDTEFNILPTVRALNENDFVDTMYQVGRQGCLPYL